MFAGIKSYLYIALAAGFLWFAMQGLGFVNEAMENAAEVILQQSQLEVRDARISFLEVQYAQTKVALEIAEQERQLLEVRNNELSAIRDAALASGEEDDGTLAPVLGDTLRALP